ncbi:cupin domain-containing protein [Roseateles oligotrophus]|uniref:Cupin domain-containing protein n=1 Tax=Roseateles oligotrophus TaxID=1769250 RepID=A0ABT2YCD1_9BURK|nr:cupin domain-containing protein [Roseateles oligotrophus]MCV2367691.1 cupin domain-containing protein [Roseateles oligotrophus]
MNHLKLHSDLTQPAQIDSQTLPWLPSPAAGVMRKLLHRDGDEVAIATSLVRYAPGSKFDRHTHDMGEEFFVLEGEFADEYGRYPAGSYVRNPWGSSHAPFTDSGCIIFVKLRQLQAEDRQRRVLDTRATAWAPGPAAGIELIPLGAFDTEQTRLVKLAPAASLPCLGDQERQGGAEIFVISGELQQEQRRHGPGSWLRLLDGDQRQTISSAQGCSFWLKTGHLPPTSGARP